MAQRQYKNIVPFGLRMQPELKERLQKEVAKRPNQSLNSEIVERLEKSLDQRQEIDAYSVGELIDALRRRLGDEAVRVRVEIGPE